MVSYNPRRLPDVLTQLQCQKLSRSLGNLKHRTLVALLYECALRLGEACTLQVHHVDGANKRIRIENSKGAKDRYVPLTDYMLDTLRLYWKTYCPGTGDAFLFPSDSDRTAPFAHRSLQRLVGEAGATAYICKKVYPHLLRHSRATHLIDAGMDIYDLSLMLGHSDIRTTTIYLHTAIDHLHDVNQIADQRIREKASHELKALRYDLALQLK